MKLYLFTPDDSPETRRCVRMYIDQVIRLSSPGSRYLPDDATIWATTRDRSLGMWVLSDISTHIRVHSTIDAGVCVINRSRVSVGRTVRDAAGDNAATFRTLQLPPTQGKDPVSTILLDHGQAGKHVNFRANSMSAVARNGVCTFDPFRVVDLPNYTVPDNATTNAFQVSHAVINGTGLMTQGLTDEASSFVQNNPDQFLINLSPERIRKLRGIESTLDKIADHYCREIIDNVRSSGFTAAMGGDWDMADAS